MPPATASAAPRPSSSFPNSTAGLKVLPPGKREVARIPGYLKPDDFLAMFRSVRDKGYETKSMPDLSKAPRT